MKRKKKVYGKNNGSITKNLDPVWAVPTGSLESLTPGVCFVYDEARCYTQPYVFENGQWVAVDKVTITVRVKK